MADTVETAIYRLRVEGQDQLDALNASLERTAVTEEKVQEGTRTTSQALQNRLARMDPLIRAQESYRKELESAQRYTDAGVGTETQRNAQVALATTRFNAQVAAIKAVEGAQTGLAVGAKVTAFEMQNLGYQVNDVVTGMLSGQKPFQVLAQQGGQIGQIFATSKASISDFASEGVSKLGAAASAVAALVTPALAVGTVMGGLALSAVAAGVHWSAAQTQVETALKGIGKQSGVTSADINDIAKAASNTSNLTIGSAREIATVFASTGKIGKDNIELATKATDGLAHSLGVDGSDAAKLLAGALADPAKGLSELEAKTGAYDLKTQELVQSLVRQGEAEKARTVLIQGVADATQNAADKTGFWAARLKDLKNGFDLVGEDVTKVVQVAGYLSGLGGVPSSGLSKQSQLNIAQGDLSKFQQSMPEKLASANSAGSDAGRDALVQDTYSSYAKLLDKVNELKAAAREEALAPLNKSLKESASAADNAVNAYVPQIQKIRETEDAIEALTKAQQDQAIAGTQVSGVGNDAALVAARNQLQALKEAANESVNYNQRVAEISQSWGNVSQSTALALQASQNQLPVIQAVGGAAKMAAQYAADYANAMDKGKTSTDAAALAADRLSNAQAAALAAAQQGTQSLVDQNELGRAKTLWQQKSIASEQAYQKVLKDVGDTEEGRAAARARAQAVEDQYNQKIKDSLAGAARAADGVGTAVTAAGQAQSQAAASALQWQQNMLGVGAAAQQAAAASVSAAEAFEAAQRAAQGAFFGRGGDFGDFNVPKGQQGTFAGLPGTQTLQQSVAIANADAFRHGGNVFGPTTTTTASNDNNALNSAVNQYLTQGDFRGAITSALNSTAATDQDRLSSINTLTKYGTSSGQYTTDQLLSILQSQPETLVRDRAISDLMQSVDQLTSSTDKLNATNTELLSPYYTQDPRTSHIGFRTQGMATGGEVTVPGGYSANDNMLAQVPVASGEIIAVRRPGQDVSGGGKSSTQNVTIIQNFNVAPGTKTDEFGRTAFQAAQSAARQIKAAS